MTRKARKLLISLAVLAAVIGILLVLRGGRKNIGGEPTGQAAESVILTEFASADLRSIKAESALGTLHLYSSDGANWMIADVPEFYRLLPDKAAATVRGFANIRSSNTVTQDGDAIDPADFGLVPPEAVVTIKDRKGNTAILEFGSRNPGGSGRYARLADSETVVIAPNYIADRAFGSADDYRDKSLPQVNLQELTGLTFRHDGTAFVLEPRTEANPYVSYVSAFDVIAPFRGRYPLEDYRLTKILEEETPLPTTVQAYRDDLDAADPSLGLDPDTADTLFIADASGDVLSLIVGGREAGGGRYAVLGDRSESVFILSEKDVAFLNTDPFDLIGKFVFLGSIVDVSRVKVEQGGTSWVMDREERGDPEDSKDDGFAVNGLVTGHKEFTQVYQKFISIMWEGQISERQSLGTPEVRITVSHDEPGIEPAVIRFWPYDDIYYQAAVGDQPLEFLVGRYQVENFIGDLAALAEFAS